MAENSNFKFTKGSIVHVMATRGVNRLNIGLSTSMKAGTAGVPDVQPTEDLLVLEVKGSGFALVQRPDGTQVHTHVNHVSPETTYNQTRKRPVSGVGSSPARGLDPVAELKASLEALKAAKARVAEAQVGVRALLTAAAEVEASGLLGDIVAPAAEAPSIPEEPATPTLEMTEEEELAAIEKELATV